MDPNETLHRWEIQNLTAEGDQQPAGAELLPRGLPLPWVDMSAILQPTELVAGAAWPNPRLQDRQTRLDDLLAAWRGDLRKWSIAPAAVATATPFGRRFTATMAQTVGASPPQIVGPDAEDREVLVAWLAVLRAATETVDLMLRYGRGHVAAARDDKGTLVVRAVDPRHVVPLTTGENAIVLLNQTATQPGPLVGALEVWVFRDSGVVERYAGTWEGGNDRLGTGVVKTLNMVGAWSQGILRTIDATPTEIDGWGCGIIADIIPALWQHAVRQGSYNRILDAHEKPMVVWRGGERDYSSLLDDKNVPQSDVLSKLPPALARWRGQNVATVPNVAMRIDYLTWDGSLTDSSAMLDRLEAQMRMMADVPSLLESGGTMPTGSALRRLMFPLLVRTLLPQYVLRVHLEDAVRLRWPDATVEWEHILDVLGRDGQNEPDHDEPDDEGPTDGAPDMDSQGQADDG